MKKRPGSAHLNIQKGGQTEKLRVIPRGKQKDIQKHMNSQV